MVKLRTLYVCSQCEATSAKWQGKCVQCGAWNSMVEDVVNVGKSESKQKVRRPSTKPQKLTQERQNKERLTTDIAEFDQVVGGGLVQGSLTLLSGEPGIGKSTLTLQLVNQLAAKLDSVLYATGEESTDQVRDRAQRLNCKHDNIELLYETDLDNLRAQIQSQKPSLLIVDSIQVFASADITGNAGGLSQVRYVTEQLMNTIKTANIPTILIGHVNKDGKIAGPKVLEHLVDTVLILEGERDHELRMLRAIKNRFGSVSEVGLFEMDSSGLKELKNPAEKLLNNRPKNASGTALTMTLHGNRPLLMEVQALVSRTHFGYPKRTASGFDRNRLELLIAVLQKHTKLNLAEHDVYLNIVGGLRLSDPAADAAVCMAIASSLKKVPLKPQEIYIGEVGLTGEIRPSFRQDERLKAIKKLGLTPPSPYRSIDKLVKDIDA